jgi:hypothetical protein
MKKILTIIALLSLLNLNAQEIKYGLKGGSSLSKVNYNIPEVVVGIIQVVKEQNDFAYAIGFQGGGFIEWSFSNKFAFQPELLYSYQNAKYETNSIQNQTFGPTDVNFTINIKTTLATSRMQVPLLIKYYALEKLFFVTGPQVGFLVNTKSTSTGFGAVSLTTAGVTTTQSTNLDSADTVIKNSFQKVNFGFALGGGYYITKNISAEVRYNLGFTDDKQSQEINFSGQTYKFDITAKSSNFQLLLGYRF